MLLTWILKELITACIKREAKSKLYTLETRDSDKNNETLCNMHANLTRQQTKTKLTLSKKSKYR